MKSQQEQKLRAQVDQARGELEDLTAGLRGIDAEVESLAPQRAQIELLNKACGSLEKLEELGAAELFWGERVAAERIAEQLSDARSRASEFEEQIVELDQRRQAILDDIGREEEVLEILGEDLFEIQEAEEQKKLEWIVERDIGPLPRRFQRMAWARGGAEDRRFYKSLAWSLAAGALLGLVLPLIPLPLPKRFLPEEMPKRIAQLVRPELPKPAPAPPVAQDKSDQPEPVPAEETPPPKQVPEEPVIADAKPLPADKPGPGGPEEGGTVAPRRNVGKAGILAFRNKFASLAQDEVAPRLGAHARFGNADDVSGAAMPTRSMLTTNAPGSSGGINIGALSRNVGGNGNGGGGGGAGGIQGVQVGQATSNIADIGGGGRPLAGGGGGQAATRTDEEIQIVFDRYKASFYRLYNRKLRSDPTLRGQVVLRLTIEPDGSVSMCELQSTDMDAPDLTAQVVGRVRAINFGAKEGVEALTIVYPIDFLPKA